LPLLTKQFHNNESFDDNDYPGRFVKIQNEESDEKLDKNIKDPERLKDHLLFQVLQLLLKICASCDVFLKNKQYREYTDIFAGK
jgi:hypothetical protein